MLRPPLLLELLMLQAGRIGKSPPPESLEILFFFILEFTTIFQKSSKNFQKVSKRFQQNSQNFRKSFKDFQESSQNISKKFQKFSRKF
jgi:hypothetical protein